MKLLSIQLKKISLPRHYVAEKAEAANVLAESLLILNKVILVEFYIEKEGGAGGIQQRSPGLL